MTSFEIERLSFSAAQQKVWAESDERHRNWPVVYTIDSGSTGAQEIYVGESLNVASRMRQHHQTGTKSHLTDVRLVIDETFNKSAALDLESYLIRYLAGDGRFRVLNRNDGITDAEYFGRQSYQATFTEIFDELFQQGLFTRTIPEIVNSDLFKLSPFKSLNVDQAAAVEDILEGLFADLRSHTTSMSVIQGDPGTGKTIVAIYLMKLIRDIADSTGAEDLDADSVFSEFFLGDSPTLLRDLRIGLVVPQQSLRKSIERVFKRTPGLTTTKVMTPFEVGADLGHFDLLIVDEAHRLNQRANQASGPLNKKFTEITEALFGSNDLHKTQLDWIMEKSTHQIFLLDAAQSVRPADLPPAVVDHLVATARSSYRLYPLTSQMRVAGGSDYIEYVGRILSDERPRPEAFDNYDFRLFDDLADLRAELAEREAQFGLARLVAGYAWPWNSKKDSAATDIEIDGIELQWNQTQKDWINSTTSVFEVGSIHTVQGYDLNYAGVIIGPDLRFDVEQDRIVFDRAHYFDKKGKENNPALGLTYSDEDLLQLVRNIYRVLLTRGMRGTYVYVCDEPLREHLRQLFVSPSKRARAANLVTETQESALHIQG